MGLLTIREKVELVLSEIDDGQCTICGEDLDLEEKMHIDHIIPFTKGGDNHLMNLRLTHPRCNIKKRDSLPW